MKTNPFLIYDETYNWLVFRFREWLILSLRDGLDEPFESYFSRMENGSTVLEFMQGTDV